MASRTKVSPDEDIAAGEAENAAASPGLEGIAPVIRATTIFCASFALLSFPCGSVPLVPQADFSLLSYVSTALGALIAVGLCLATFLYSVRIDIAAQYRWLSPLLTIGGLLFMLGTPAAIFAGDVANSIADISIIIVLFVYLISYARNVGLDPVLTVGIALGGSKLGLLLGNLAGYATSGSLADTRVMLGVLIGVFAATTALIPTHAKTVENQPSPKAGGVVSEIARAYALSAREAEVFELLAKGRSVPYIRDRLGLSKNTVASHTKSIYTKLGVHSKQELIDFANSHGME